MFSFVAGKTCFGLFAVKLGCFRRYWTEKMFSPSLQRVTLIFTRFYSKQRLCLFSGKLRCLQYGVWRNSLFLFSYTNCAVNPLVSAAFAPYRNRPFVFAPTLYCVRPHTFRVRPHQVVFVPTLYRIRPHTFRVRPHSVEFAPWLSDIQISWFVRWWVNSSVLMNGYKSNNLSNAAAMKAWFASSQVWLLRSTHFVFVR